MKYMFASDIHGSAYYCRKMLEAFEAEGASRLFLLGTFSITARETIFQKNTHRNRSSPC